MNKQLLLAFTASFLFVVVFSDCSETYTAWVLRGTCNDTCGGFGVQKMIRACVTNCTCQGPFDQWTLCNDNPCVFPRPACGNGLQRVVVNGNGFVCGYVANDSS